MFEADEACEQEVAGLCLALLPAQAPPLVVGLALLRLAGMSKRFGTHELRRLLSSVERKLRRAPLPEDARVRLTTELPLALPAAPSPVGSGGAPAKKRARLIAAPRKERTQRMPSALPLSADPNLWRRTRDYYEQSGSRAWTSGVVPCHISTSALIASQYATIIASFIDFTNLSKQVEAYNGALRDIHNVMNEWNGKTRTERRTRQTVTKVVGTVELQLSNVAIALTNGMPTGGDAEDEGEGEEGDKD